MSKVHLVSTEPATYADLEDAPEHYTAELIGGRLHAMPRPKARHIHTASILGASLLPPFDWGRGGPGGWWILNEPEIHFILNKEVTVPDLAGWRRERMPELPDDQRFTVTPDWLCEILSPTTRKHDLDNKVPLYARYGVPFLWLIDVDAPWLSTQALEDGRYLEIDRFGPGDMIRARPFEAVELRLF